jgi:hypothetical protein
MRFGSIEGDFRVRATVCHGVESVAVLENGSEESDESWKKRYMDLRQQIRNRDETVGRLKRGVLDALVVSNQFSGI